MYLNRPASTTDPTTWRTYESVSGFSSNTLDGVGYIINIQHTQLLGVDLDHVIKDGKLVDSTCLEFLEEANTYTELSPSGDGLHVVFKLSNPGKLQANKKANDNGTAYECYTDGRYFTFTGKVFHSYDRVKTVTLEEAEKTLSVLGYPWRKSQHIASISSSPSVPNLTDGEVLQKAFSSQNGNKIKKLYHGDISDYNDDHSSADLALCSYLAFWSGRQDQVERIWLYSPLGDREKTQQREDYRERTISHVFETKTEFYNPITEISAPVFFGNTETKTKKKKPKLIGRENKDGVPIIKPILENVVRLMRYEVFAEELRYNLFSNKIEYKGENLEDQHVIEIWSEFQVKFPDMSNVSKAIVQDALVLIARENKYNPVVDWLHSLEWDGVRRLDEFVDQVFGYPSEDTEDFILYREAVGTMLFKSLVARALDPGVKYDHMIVLEGKQGCGKSTFIQALAGIDYVYETIAKDITDKDFHVNSSQSWIVHFDEGESIKYNSIESLKHMITAQKSIIRLPYARNDITIAKKYIFMMSTNDAQYLRDKTGNRRFLPLKIYLDFVDIQWFRENRDQLFAEAVALWETDKSFKVPEAEAQRQQEERMMVDPIDALVEDYIASLDSRYLEDEGVVYSEIWQEEFDREPNRNDILRIHTALSRLGFKQRQVRVGNKRVRKWFRDKHYHA